MRYDDRGLCGLVCPSRTSERGEKGDCVKGGVGCFQNPGPFFTLGETDFGGAKLGGPAAVPDASTAAAVPVASTATARPPTAKSKGCLDLGDTAEMDADIHLCGRLPRAQSKSFFDLGEDAGKWQQKFFVLARMPANASLLLIFFLCSRPRLFAFSGLHISYLSEHFAMASLTLARIVSMAVFCLVKVAASTRYALL